MAGLGLQLPESAKLPVSGARSDLPLVWQPSTKALVNFLNVEYAAWCTKKPDWCGASLSSWRRKASN